MTDSGLPGLVSDSCLFQNKCVKSGKNPSKTPSKVTNRQKVAELSLFAHFYVKPPLLSLLSTLVTFNGGELVFWARLSARFLLPGLDSSSRGVILLVAK